MPTTNASPCALTVQALGPHEAMPPDPPLGPAPWLVLWEAADSARPLPGRRRRRPGGMAPRCGGVDIHGLDGRPVRDVADAGCRRLVVRWPQDWPLVFGPHEGPAVILTRLHLQDPLLARLIRRLHAHQRASEAQAAGHHEPHGRLQAHLLSRGIVRRAIHDAGASAVGTAAASPASPAWASQLDALIDRFLDAPLGAESLATATGMGMAAFQQSFRQCFGTSVHQHLLRRRIERAQRLLLRDDLPLAELAQRLGFASHAHFSSSFSARTGMAPSRYRRLALSARPSAAAA